MNSNERDVVEDIEENLLNVEIRFAALLCDFDQFGSAGRKFVKIENVAAVPAAVQKPLNEWVEIGKFGVRKPVVLGRRPAPDEVRDLAPGSLFGKSEPRLLPNCFTLNLRREAHRPQ